MNGQIGFSMASWPEPKIIQIGSQQLYDIGDRLRFTIKDILPVKGYYGQFGIRDRIIEEAIKRAKPLQIMFEQREDWVVMHNPIYYKAVGKLKKQVGYYKDNPMNFYFFYINNRGEITREKENQEQGVLFI